MLLGGILAAGATAGTLWAAGLGRVADQLALLRWEWLLAAAAGQLLAYVAYIAAYREVARVDRGPEFDPGDLAALVSTGFGVFIPRGGFAVDTHALQEAGVEEREARVRVLGLGALEYAILAPAACVAAAYVILARSGQPHLGMTLPWAVAVPGGALVALVLMRFRDRWRGRGRVRDRLAHGLDGVAVLRKLAARPGTHWPAAAGMALYWFADVFTLWACLRAVTAHPPSVPVLLVGYATGYALTRRSLPLAGAGVVEALLPFSLHWVGIALAPAVLAVAAYRVFNLWLLLVPAALGLQELRRRDRAGRRRRGHRVASRGAG